MKQRVSAVVRRSSAAPAAGSFGNKDLHTERPWCMPPAWVGGTRPCVGVARWKQAEWSAGHVRLALRGIPGCELDAWMSDYAMPKRAVAPEEQIWSSIMDPAAKFLDQRP